MQKLSAALHEKAQEKAVTLASIPMKSVSVQYAVMRGSEIVLSGCAGVYDNENSRPLDENIMYGIGSVSKVYVAASAMLLTDKGQLDIDKPYKDYVPEFEMADERYKQITARHLLNHSSGIYGSHFRGSFLFDDNSTYVHDSLLDNLKICSLKFAPGVFSEYCNDGFQLLEILVERISKMSYTAFLRKYFFEPLGIKNTKTPLDTYDKSQIARAYMPVCEGPLPIETTNVIGTGGIYSTAEDVCRFGQVLMGKTILSAKSAAAMQQNEYANGLWPGDEDDDNYFAYGLGWDHVHLPPFNKYGIKALWKGGDTIQFHSSIICLPEQDMTAAVVSSGGISVTDALLATDLLNEALLEYGIIKELPQQKVFQPPVKADMPESMNKYAGIYADNGKFTEIAIKDGAFELPALLSGLVPAQSYVYASDGLFINPDGSVSVCFVETKNGPTFIQANISLVFPGVGTIPWKCFLYQRPDPNPIDEKTAATWEKRHGKRYLTIDDMPSSIAFLTPFPITEKGVPVDTTLGYAYGGCRIVDENYAKNILYFRDVIDLRLFQENGKEYLRARGETYIREDFIPSLDIDMTAATISPNGYTQYFRANENAAGKTINVDLPVDGTFIVYDKNVGYKNLSTVTGKTTAELAEGDLVALVGSPGSVFKVLVS